MIDYAELAAVALAALTDAAPVPIIRRAYSIGDYDPATGTAATTMTETQRIGVVVDYAAMSVIGQQNERGTLIQHGDKNLFLDATGPVDLGDHYIVNGVEYTVVSISEPVAGASILYDIHLRT